MRSSAAGIGTAAVLLAAVSAPAETRMVERVLAARMGQHSRYGRRQKAHDHQHYWQPYEQSPTQR